MDNLELRHALEIIDFCFKQGQRGDTIEETRERAMTMIFGAQWPEIVRWELSRHERKAQEDRNRIAAAVQKMHSERGCCDGTFREPCPWKEMQAKEREAERLARKPKPEKPWDEYEGTGRA
jgi:hypothetical protein